jgi:hypothetical protein
MFATITFKKVKLVETRKKTILCQIETRLFEIPFGDLWDFGDDLPKDGEFFDLHVSTSYARKNGLAQ